MTGRVHSIESFGTVDGPGIRLVIFMQGCPLRCLYCHNPDTWNTSGGKETTVNELLSSYEKNRAYYKNGGITVSGGEPLLQAAFVTELFSSAANAGIHTCLDTSGAVFSREKGYIEIFDRLLAVTNLVLLDIKHIDSARHRELTGISNENILDFARYLSEKSIPVWIRHVVVPGCTDMPESLFALGRFIGTLKNVQALEVLPYHTMGTAKYHSLGFPYPLEGVSPLTEEKAAEARITILRGIKAGRENGMSSPVT